VTAYRGYAQGGSVEESFTTDADGQQVPVSYGPPLPTQQPPASAPTSSPVTISGPGAMGPPLPSNSPNALSNFSPAQQRYLLQQALDNNKTVLASADFGSKKYTDALQSLSGLRSQLTAHDYAMARPAGVLSAAQTAGMAQGRDLAARMYPSLNPAAAAQMFPTVAPTQGRIPRPYNTSSMYSNLPPAAPSRRRDNRTFADGGIASLAQGGYPRMTGAINGPGTETSDSIPAMLSNNEFVFTAKAVRGAGGGSARQGAKRMYALMHQLERNAARG